MSQLKDSVNLNQLHYSNYKKQDISSGNAFLN